MTFYVHPMDDKDREMILNLYTGKEYEAMEEAITLSTNVWIVGADDDIMGFFGIKTATVLSDTIYLWCQTLPGLSKHTFLFTLYSRRIIQELLRTYPRIVGFCLRSEKSSQRWLKWLGATFDRDREGPYIGFEIKAR